MNAPSTPHPNYEILIAAARKAGPVTVAARLASCAVAVLAAHSKLATGRVMGA